LNTTLTPTRKTHVLRHKSHRGFGLLEALAALVVVAAVALGVTLLLNRTSDDARAGGTAQHMATVGQAANVFVRDNFAAIVNTANATQPMLVTVADLISHGSLRSGQLPTGFNPVNDFGHTLCVLIFEPTQNRLHGMVIAQGGDAIDDVTLALVAASIGSSGGAVYSTDANTIRGAMGSWSAVRTNFARANNRGLNCAGASGLAEPTSGRPVMQIWFADGAANEAMYRDAVTGNPALNTMNTPIMFGVGAQRSEGAACAANEPDGSIAVTSAGRLLTCESRVWRRCGT